MSQRRPKVRLRTSTCPKNSEVARTTVVNLEKHYLTSEVVCMKTLCSIRAKAFWSYRTRSHKPYSQHTMKTVAYQGEMKESKQTLKWLIKQRKCSTRSRKSFKCQNSEELLKSHLSVVFLAYSGKILNSSSKSMPKMKTKTPT